MGLALAQTKKMQEVEKYPRRMKTPKISLQITALGEWLSLFSGLVRLWDAAFKIIQLPASATRRILSCIYDQRTAISEMCVKRAWDDDVEDLFVYRHDVNESLCKLF